MAPSGSFSVERVASLARLEVGENTDELSDQLSRMIEFVDVLESLDLKDVEPFFGTASAPSASEYSDQRRDQPEISFERTIALRNAPDQDGEFYRVPPVF